MSILLIALAIGALALLQSWVYKKNWNKRISLLLSFSEKVATEGETLRLTEVITNRKLLPLPWLAVKFQVSRHLLFHDQENAAVSDDFYRSDLFNLLPYRRITRTLPFTCGKRGYYTIKSAELVSGDILARQKFAMGVACQAALTVYPRELPLDTLLQVHRQFLGQVLTKRYIQPDPFEFKGIREYQPYDSLRAINFKATAKAGDWMVNVNDYTVTQEIILLLNLQPYSAYPDPALFEQTIRLAASLAAYYIDNGVSLGFITNAAPDSALGEDVTYLRLESGASARHTDNIRNALAHVDLSRDVPMPGAALLWEAREHYAAGLRAGRQPSYIILSTDHRTDFVAAHAALCDTGADVLWLIPVNPGMEVKVPQSERVVVTEMAG